MVFIQLNQRREKRPLPDGDRKASTPSKQRRPVRKGRIGPGVRTETRVIKKITKTIGATPNPAITRKSYGGGIRGPIRSLRHRRAGKSVDKSPRSRLSPAPNQSTGANRGNGESLIPHRAAALRRAHPRQAPRRSLGKHFPPRCRPFRPTPRSQDNTSRSRTVIVASGATAPARWPPETQQVPVHPHRPRATPPDTPRAEHRRATPWTRPHDHQLA